MALLAGFVGGILVDVVVATVATVAVGAEDVSSEDGMKVSVRDKPSTLGAVGREECDEVGNTVPWFGVE